MDLPKAPSNPIILFGGTFDPPHNGHQMCIESVVEKVPQGQILVMPTPLPPPLDSKSPSKKAVAAYTQRVAMCELAFKSIAQVTVSRLESTLPAPQYTYCTLEAIAKHLPQESPTRLAMIVGEDQFWGLGAWKNPETIVSMVQLIVIGRPAPSLEQQWSKNLTKKQLSLLSAQRHIQQILERSHPLGRTPPTPLLLNQRACAASSSEIRRKFLGGEPIPTYWIQDSVMKYIHDHKLYGVN